MLIQPKIRIVATILAKNEQDIIASTIEHHLSQGVYKIILTDNDSSDDTRRIAEKYPDVEIIDEPGNDHNQSLWVTRMAQIACKFNPDWIIHLDADEHWCGLMSLAEVQAPVASCQKMYLHPPVAWDFNLAEMNHYLSFDDIPIPQESKVAHRPDPQIVISHGNHGIETGQRVEVSHKVWRHHYPIRSYDQWERKSTGHLALMRRNATCERWKMWYDLKESGKMPQKYTHLISTWGMMIKDPQIRCFQELLEFWATPDLIMFFKNNPNFLPKIHSR